MRLVSINRCVPGERIAKPIYNNNGTTLVGEGVTLTQRMIDRLKQSNIVAVYVKDNALEDIIIEDVISEKTRQQAMGVITNTFKDFQDNSVKQRNKNVISDKMGQQFSQIMGNLIDELKNNRSALSLLGTVCGVDNYVFAHSFNVTLYTVTLAIRMGLNQKELMEIGLGAILHDIGKMMIPYEILTKPGKLTNDEYDIIKQHTEFGFEILRKQRDLSLLTAHCAFQHHERIDGKGYPRRLKDAEIHPYAKMMSVCDVYDALTTNRSYRGAMLPHEAIEILYAGAGTHFAKEYIEGFKDTIAIYPIGLSITLNTGEEGVVVAYNRGLPDRPVVRVLKEPNGEQLRSPYDIDLSQKLNVLISACDGALVGAV